ncbi:MAG: elongation factor P [Luteitalea sp.]|nr:elongation factor P [Luteitalea sp.]
MSVSIQATRLRRGNFIKHNTELYRVLETVHMTPGNKRGFVRAKLRKVRDGTLLEHKFRSEDFIERGILDERQMQFVYRDAAGFYFMDLETYEQVHLSDEALGDSVNYLLPELTLRVEFHEGQPVGIELPTTVDLKVLETVPGIKGATAAAQVKPATLETGLVVNVPAFVGTGDVIRVSTETGEYLSRAG